MRRTIYVCDKCGKEIDEVEATTYEIYNHDFCEKCALEASKVIKIWISEVPAKKEVVAEAIKEVIEAPEEVKKIEETVKEELTPKRHKMKQLVIKSNPRKPIDWDKACALKKAGWSNKNIADELGANEGTISAMIYQKVKDYDAGKRYGKPEESEV